MFFCSFNLSFTLFFTLFSFIFILFHLVNNIHVYIFFAYFYFTKYDFLDIIRLRCSLMNQKTVKIICAIMLVAILASVISVIFYYVM